MRRYLASLAREGKHTQRAVRRRLATAGRHHIDLDAHLLPETAYGFGDTVLIDKNKILAAVRS